MIRLVGVLVVIVGLGLKLNPLLVVIVAGFSSGLAGGMGPYEILEAIGTAFVTNRYMSLFILTLPVIGLLERHGLREQAELFIMKLKGATAGRIMLLYMFFRQATSAVGLQLGGHPTFIRPIISPMAEGAVAKGRELPQSVLDEIRSMAAAVENYGNFFGQLIFIAAGGLLLIKGVMDQAGYSVDLLTMALYAVPTAVAAFAIATVRYTMFDARMKKLSLKGEEERR
ncbi:DUF969 domain-containing protein [Dethiosulfovibrio salsuginis]|uniref:Uncharacterized membrane protein n=1 Tax=Dethiosulfovibrio salsuginis TaxID=561720 RepID=A0A1X7LFM4_9BACT|nr:DUF969 domain-containing protein [Dethiosulfovibrio salsuginis]SMG52052.1 Uncharacterized membrane protein [Dethiosulfovibrio salsuginis]